MNGLNHWLTAGIAAASRLRGNPEFESALVRIAVCLFGAFYIGLAGWTGYYRINVAFYLILFPLYLLTTLAFLFSVARRPIWQARRYLALCLDLIVVSLAIFITREAISPFYLLYILIFISAGTRFGKDFLVVASLVAVLAYNFVLIALDEWQRHTFEAAFFMLLLVLLPLYQAALLKQVQRARDEAEQANKAKGDFLAFMTHELRTPLTGVIGMAELLKNTRLDTEQCDYVRAIDSSARSLNALIGDILDYSKIDAGKLTLERIAFDPRDLMRDVCAILEGPALAGGLELICDVAPEVPAQVIGDQLRVRQILFNLLGNAVKFTEQGEILIRASRCPPDASLSQAHLLLEVVDTGIGIPADKLPTLFESFRQADESTTRRFGGSGLGTTIARDLTRLMGGVIGVESIEGQGSRFWVRLPLIDAAFPAPRTAPAGRLSGIKALVLERNPTQRALILAILEREGTACAVCAEPDEILAVKDGLGGADLLLVADCPSGRDLNAVLAAGRSMLGCETPGLFLTYAGRPLSAPAARAAALNKPFLAEDLIQAVTGLLGLVPAESDVRPRVSAPLAPLSEQVGTGKVLVAEDNKIAAKVITTFLTRMGFEPVHCPDGESALTAALSGDYRIAIVDLRMPGLDGIGFAKRYREEAPDRPLPIVALTANAAEDIKQACLAAGMDGFLAKPVLPAALRQMLQQLI